MQGRFKQALASPDGEQAEILLEEQVSDSIKRLHCFIPEYF